MEDVQSYCFLPLPTTLNDYILLPSSQNDPFLSPKVNLQYINVIFPTYNFMKPKGQYQIHALIGKCHLHNKKNALYSITLKMGTKAIANTEFKLPSQDEINFNTQLILKIDKTLYESAGKQLSLIVTLLNDDKDKKIIGTVLVNYKQKGLQTVKVAQCSCKDKSFEVNLEFEVVNLQLHNNNLSNNKFLSPTHSEMKDLKKALTISREKELIKSSRTKATPGTKSPVEKTEPKLSRQKLQTKLKQEISPDLSSLTTKISPHAPKSVEESKQVIADLRNKIQQLQTELKQALNRHKSSRKQIYSLQNEIETLKKENQCLLEILAFEEEKSSAALQYITFLTQKIYHNQVEQDHFNECFDLIQTVKNTNTSAVDQIKSAAAKKQLLRQNSFFGFQPIEEKVQHFDQSTERLVEELQEYKLSIRELKQKIIDMESKENQKNYAISKFEKQITEFKQENSVLNVKNRKLEESIKEYDYKLNSIKLEGNKSEAQRKLLEKSLSETKKQFYEVQNELSVAKNELSQTRKALQKMQNELSLVKGQLSDSKKDVSQTTNNYDKCKREVNEWKMKFESVLRDNKQLQETILKLELRIQELEQAKEKLELSSEKLKKQQPVISKPQTPTQSEIMLRKTRFVDGEQLQNMIKQMNTQSSPLKESIPSKDFLRGSEKNKHSGQNQAQNDSDRFLSRNKSESLLKDLQQSDPEQSGIEEILDAEDRNDQAETKEAAMKSTNKVVIIPEHKKQVQKYNYDFDIDSVNYFNNFAQSHEIMETSGDHQNNSSQNDIEQVSIKNLT